MKDSYASAIRSQAERQNQLGSNMSVYRDGSRIESGGQQLKVGMGGSLRDGRLSGNSGLSNGREFHAVEQEVYVSPKKQASSKTNSSRYRVSIQIGQGHQSHNDKFQKRPALQLSNSQYGLEPQHQGQTSYAMQGLANPAMIQSQSNVRLKKEDKERQRYKTRANMSSFDISSHQLPQISTSKKEQ